MVPSSTPNRTASTDNSEVNPAGSTRVRHGRSAGVNGSGRLLSLLRAVAFWSAVVLPFLHLPLLLSGLDTRADLLALATLFGLNLVALAIGRSHRPEAISAGGRSKRMASARSQGPGDGTVDDG